MECREVRTDFNCDSCYELTIEDCNEINIDAGLAPETNFFLHIYDQFDIRRTQQITTKVDGSFDIDLSLLPDNYFNPYGNYDLYVSTQEDGSDKVKMIFESEEFTCIILIVE